MKAAAIAGGVLAAAYPFAVYFGLDLIEPRTLALIVAVAAGLRVLQVKRIFGAADVAALGATALLAAAVAWSNSETLLKFYPVVVSLGLLASFGLTLKYGPPMVERFARLREPDLGRAGMRYTRRVTIVWCAFFAINAAVALYTAVAASREAWLLYNGFVSYCIVAALFAGEWLVRRRVMPKLELAEPRL